MAYDKILPLEIHPSGSILRSLEEDRIFGIEASEGEFIFNESCDCYFFRKVTKDQMIKLIVELQSLVDANA